MTVTTDSLTEGMVNAGDNLFLDPQGNWMTTTAGGNPVANQWVWGDNGITALGGNPDFGVIQPFLDIQEKYRGGTPITADTWQDAVQKSLEGFMRVNYGTDPAVQWNANSGGAGSSFRLGTLQQLINDRSIPGMFFNTGGNFTLPDALSYQFGVDPGQASTRSPQSFDPLMGMNADTKLLGFEDTPLSQIEQWLGPLPGAYRMLNPEAAAIQQKIVNIQDQYSKMLDDAGGDRMKMAAVNAFNTTASQQIAALTQQYNALTPFLTLDQVKNNPLYQDYNDYLFALDINNYAPPPELIKASPDSVLKKFFNTPEYQLAFGKGAVQLDPNSTPVQRFQQSPGYQYQVDEGQRNIQKNAAAKGLLQSGSTLRDLQDYGQNTANQDFSNYQGQIMGLYGDWQNQLKGLAGQGAQISTANQAAAMQTGGALASNQQQLGSNLGNLFSNQGTFGGSSFLNTGAAKSSNVMQGLAIQAQIDAANAAGKAQSGGAAASGIGQIAGKLMGGAF